MKNKSTAIYKSNKIIEAGYRLSLNEQRLILACIAKIDSRKKLSETKRFEVTAKEFSNFFKINEDKAYQTLKNVSEQLFERYVMIDNPDPHETTLKQTKTRWVASIDYIPALGKIVLYFAPRMLPYLSELQGQFTFYQLQCISEMRSIYGIRLYELLMQWKVVGTREIKIDELKQKFQLEGKYSSIKDFKKRVLEPAINDINTHSDYSVTWTQRKTGRRVTHLIFMFSEKPTKTLAKSRSNEPMIKGVAKSEIESKARRGELWEAAAQRIKSEKQRARRGVSG